MEENNKNKRKSIAANGGKAVADAFMRVYGIDLKKAGALNSAYLDAIRLK